MLNQIIYSIPAEVTSIGEYAFVHAPSLTSVTIPGSVTSINANAFCDCEALTKVTYHGTTDPGDASLNIFYGCNNLHCVLVPTSYPFDTFCGHPVGKGDICQAQTPPPSNGLKNWFIDNAAWMVPLFSISVSAVGLLLKYDKVKNFCLSHCCHEENETTETGTLDEKLL